VRRLIEVGPAVAYAALIFFLSSQSSFPVPQGVWDFDKLIHCVEYGGLGFLTARAFVGLGFHSPARVGAICATLYGVSDELHQYFVPGRSCDVRDVAADAVGAALGAFAFHTWRRWRVRRGS
jgi:VanZ family protein